MWLKTLPLMSAILLGIQAADPKRPVVCYYYGAAQMRPSPMNYAASNIPGHLCSHVTLAFVTVSTETFEIQSAISSYMNNTGLYREFTSIKKQYSHLRTLLSVGGWEFGHSVFSTMAGHSLARRRFVKSAVRWMREYGFDGLDISWQYPGMPMRGGNVYDKDNFVHLMKELNTEFKKYDFMLTITVPIDPVLLKSGFNVAALSRYVNWFNVFAHDLRGTWTGYADVHSPLRRRCFDENYYAALNVEDGMARLVKLGAPKKKLMLGIPFYGRSFTLQDPRQNSLMAPIRKDVSAMPGQFVMSDEILAYYEVCMDITMRGWKRNYDAVGQCPYAYRDDQWVGYEDEESVSAKVDFVMDKDYGGVMVFNVDMDDFQGVCGMKNPLLNAIGQKFTEGQLIDPRLG
ncbi:unnamed protein product [Ixodes persulcatus]